MPTEYDKLVRDRIPELIDATDEQPVIHIADDEEYADRLAAKLTEEAVEYQDSRELEELADVLAVLHAILEDRGRTMADLETRRREKRAERGGFEDRIVLERVEPE
ncbi:nucleoside triphosphate pyrophosphohydrolase [Halosolutus halophilus]|uniref:nucleoside triphosphate pyrophosphohydrolase n=1 Tax=Halosolutus halophilus TaxID=1552990 RepID=UPI002234F503|nr:nucleoside triphosphate pyrophosphohydrolase [Halosolutus halophilus]